MRINMNLFPKPLDPESRTDLLNRRSRRMMSSICGNCQRRFTRPKLNPNTSPNRLTYLTGRRVALTGNSLLSILGIGRLARMSGV
jgi:hypothetical protein